MVIEENIFWFDIAMKDMTLMSIGERLSDLDDDRQCFLQIQPLRRQTIQPMTQRATGDILPHDIWLPLLYSKIQDRNDRGVPQLFDLFTFLEKSRTLLVKGEACSLEYLEHYFL